MTLLRRAAIVVPALALFLCAPGSARIGSMRSCQFVSAPRAVAAFCDKFNHPMGTGNRSGELDGLVWGVSRATSNNNPPQGMLYSWAAVGRDTCGRPVLVRPEQDVAICDGQAVEAVNDNGGVTDLAMYPRQPFDFAGRTGTVKFDVSDNSEGPHAAWPAFLITDQPVPAPYQTAAGLADHARNSVGFSLASLCGQFGCGHNLPPGAGKPGFSCLGVDSMFMTVHYVQRAVHFRPDGCVRRSTRVGSNNHVEVRISAAGMRVYAADPGRPSTTRLIADAHFKVPLTRGLVWIEDVHYNGNKFNHQQTNTFSWDNVAFDGPVLPRDLGFDVLDATSRGAAAENGLPTYNIGYYIPGGGTLKLTIPRVVRLGHAAGSLLEFTYWAENRQTITYSLNHHRALRFRWPFGNQATYVSETAAMPVSLGNLRDGANALVLRTSDPAGVAIASVDLILQGAGGTP